MISLSYLTIAALSISMSMMLYGVYNMGKANGYEAAAKSLQAIEALENENAPVLDDIAPLVMRYREIALHAIVMPRTKHDYVFVWCKDGLHHGMHVKCGDGETLVQLLGLKPLKLRGAFGDESPRTPST